MFQAPFTIISLLSLRQSPCSYQIKLMTLMFQTFSACTLPRGMFHRNIPITSHSTTCLTSQATSRRNRCLTFSLLDFRKSTPIHKMSWQAFSSAIHGFKRWRTCWSHSNISWPRPSKCRVFCWPFSLKGNTCTTFVKSRVNTRRRGSVECGWVLIMSVNGTLHNRCLTITTFLLSTVLGQQRSCCDKIEPVRMFRMHCQFTSCCSRPHAWRTNQRLPAHQRCYQV